MLLYLHGREKSHLTPLEAFVYEEIVHGSVAWLPKGRCFSLQEQYMEEAVLERAMQEMKSTLSDVHSRLGTLEMAQHELKTELSAVHESVHAYGGDERDGVSEIK